MWFILFKVTVASSCVWVYTWQYRPEEATLRLQPHLNTICKDKTGYTLYFYVIFNQSLSQNFTTSSPCLWLLAPSPFIQLKP